jgi:hypothetical protein
MNLNKLFISKYATVEMFRFFFWEKLQSRIIFVTENTYCVVLLKFDLTRNDSKINKSNMN